MRIVAQTIGVGVGVLGLIGPAFGQTGFTPDMIYKDAAAQCAQIDNGVFSPGDAPLIDTELTGDAQPEQIIDWSSFTCSTVAAFVGGTGGTPISVLAGGQRFDWTVLDYKVVPMKYAPPVLLMMMHGSECNATGALACFEAVVWGGETFLSIRQAGGAD
jgi:hypothetical protein